MFNFCLDIVPSDMKNPNDLSSDSQAENPAIEVDSEECEKSSSTIEGNFYKMHNSAIFHLSGV